MLDSEDLPKKGEWRKRVDKGKEEKRGDGGNCGGSKEDDKMGK